jgi:hypothetical protein
LWELLWEPREFFENKSCYFNFMAGFCGVGKGTPV